MSATAPEAALTAAPPNLAPAPPSPAQILRVEPLCMRFGGLVAINAFAPRGRGVYVPAHVENGVLIPGRIE